MVDTRLLDRHVVVTGGAQGIGRGIATRVARAGADVTVFDVKREAAMETTDLVRGHGERANFVEVDVSSEEAVDTGIETAASELGPIHGLVNNAGVCQSIPIVETTVDDWDHHFDINTRGTFFCAKHGARHMIDEDLEGAIINIASAAVERPLRGNGAYAASKGAIAAFTRVLAKELGPHDIRANVIKPGTVDTPLVGLEKYVSESDRTEEKILAELTSDYILDRIGHPEEIGHLVTLLLSEEGSWITGEDINIDGGYTTE